MTNKQNNVLQFPVRATSPLLEIIKKYTDENAHDALLDEEEANVISASLERLDTALLSMIPDLIMLAGHEWAMATIESTLSLVGYPHDESAAWNLMDELCDLAP